MSGPDTFSGKGPQAGPDSDIGTGLGPTRLGTRIDGYHPDTKSTKEITGQCEPKFLFFLGVLGAFVVKSSDGTGLTRVSAATENYNLSRIGRRTGRKKFRRLR